MSEAKNSTLSSGLDTQTNLTHGFGTYTLSQPSNVDGRGRRNMDENTNSTNSTLECDLIHMNESLGFIVQMSLLFVFVIGCFVLTALHPEDKATWLSVLSFAAGYVFPAPKLKNKMGAHNGGGGSHGPIFTPQQG